MYWIRACVARLASYQLLTFQALLILMVIFVTFVPTVDALERLLDRSLTVASSEPGVTTNYKIAFTFREAPVVGSVDILFCMSPIPYEPCDIPTGLNVSNAVLSSQSGETGFYISQKTTNHIVLSRTPGPVGETPSTFVFDNIVNPTQMNHSFSARLADFESTDATGAVLNLGSVVTQITNPIYIETQVPPILIFCMSAQVSEDCLNVNPRQYTDMGDLSPDETLSAVSQMAVGTNASQGFVITVNGTTMQAGSHELTAPTQPTPSAPGTSQFGLNLRENSTPVVGQDPDGSFTNAQPTPNYDIPNKFMFKNGDVVASSPNVSLVRRFTVSYIANSTANQRAGTYTTTLTYICSGRF